MADGLLCSTYVSASARANFREKEKAYLMRFYKTWDKRYVSAHTHTQTFTGSEGILSELVQPHYNMQMKNVSLNLYKTFSSLKA